MKLGLNILGVLGLLIGGVWMLQGLDILGGSFMSGQSRWLEIGAASRRGEPGAARLGELVTPLGSGCRLSI